MNAVEIEEAVTQLALEPFDAAEFPYAFLKAFGNKDTTISRLRSGTSNASDIPNGVLQRSNIHIATCKEGETTRALAALKLSPKTAQAKARFVLTTDGVTLEAEDLQSDDPPVVCAYKEFADHFGFFLPLAGISTVKQLRESAFDIRATGRLNKLYIELRKTNPDWDKSDRQHDMNHFMARLIFCFFSEDTDIFRGSRLFTDTIEKMSAPDASNTHEVIETIFRAMNTKPDERLEAKLPRWADVFPYVNGGLFAGNTEVPRFTKIARTYLVHIGSLEWQKINPDIFGSMIQAVADDEERGALGMHYTSVTNILKVLNPLFLDDLREKLDEAGENARTLLNLRKRIARIRVFDPACGSGNFLVIAYKEMRAIEAQINKRRGEDGIKSEIPITNFRGIELLDFPAEIARLALIIAEFQCDALYRGQKEAIQEFLPLDTSNWITRGNALRIDWLSICPPTGSAIKLRGDDLFSTPLEQTKIDFNNEGGETYICGNPPYRGTKNQTEQQKDDITFVFSHHTSAYRSLDYVACWFLKAAHYSQHTSAKIAFVSTNSICQGGQVPLLWPLVYETKNRILFAHTSFTWRNLAAHNAGVTVAIIGFGVPDNQPRRLFAIDKNGNHSVQETENINAYLVSGRDVVVDGSTLTRNGLPKMSLGNQPYEGNNLILEAEEFNEFSTPDIKSFTRRIYGSSEFIRGGNRRCLWLQNESIDDAMKVPAIKERVEKVKIWRTQSVRAATRAMASRPHQFCEMNIGKKQTIIIPIRSSENREYLPVGLLNNDSVVSNLAYALYDAPTWAIGIIASRLHLVWIATVCGRMKNDYSYSNKMGWNNFPVPTLTEQNKADLTRCAEDILLAREEHFPASIADLYDPENMPDNLRAAHERNDEVFERIYIGRRFRNDTERLEKLFELYTKMISSVPNEKATRQKQKEV
jgi:hypothetical protein